jgi:multidrug efflux system outer membrane protein
MRKRALVLLVAGAFAGCAVTQPAPPQLDLPTATATAEQAALLERWWLAFDDPVLNALVEEALANNLDYRATLARIELARSQLLLAQSALYPNFNLTAGATRSRISGSASTPLPPGTPLTGNDFTVGVTMSYELDIWGKYRSGALAAANDLVASRYFREATRITIAADVADAYFRLRAADALLVVYVETQKTRTDTVGLQRDRFDAGIIGEYDLRQAEAELAAVVADIARTRQAIGLTEAAIATLTGRSPRAVFTPEVARGATIEAATHVPQLPSGLPSGLLERRPDIRRSEAELAAMDLRIQQARADYFPDITLTGLFGSEAAALSNLFTSPATIWRFGAAWSGRSSSTNRSKRTWPLRRRGATPSTIAYQQTVQNAFREVHDALVTNSSAQEVLGAETQRRDLLKQALERRDPSATKRVARRISRCSTRNGRSSPPRRCASLRRATRGYRSSISRSRSAEDGTGRNTPSSTERTATAGAARRERWNVRRG